MKTPPPLSVLRVLLAGLCVLCLGPWPAPLIAQTSGQCKVTVLEIVAENTGQGLADELKGLKTDLDKLNYSTYRLNDTHEVTISFSESKELTILGDNDLVLTAEGLDDKGMLRLKVKLSPRSAKEKGLETTMRIPDGGTFLIGGPAHGKGVIILAFTAKI